MTSRLADTAPPEGEATAQDSPLSWSVHLLRRRPAAVAPLSLCLFLVLLGGLLVFRDLRLALLPAVALLLSLSEFVFPIRYTLTGDKAQMRCALLFLEMPWRDVHHAYVTDGGIKLSPLRRRNSRFEAMRGIFLRYGEDAADRERLADAVRRLREGARGE